MRLIEGIIIGLLISICVSGFFGLISAPPPLEDSPVPLQHYLQELYSNYHILEITTTAPDTNRSGKKGQLVIYNNSGTFELYANDDGSTSWQKL